MSPQDPATQLNTFKTYVTLIADSTPGSKLQQQNSLIFIFVLFIGLIVFIMVISCSITHSSMCLRCFDAQYQYQYLSGLNSVTSKKSKSKTEVKLQCGPVPNVMVTLPNTGGALCSMPQNLACTLLECRAVTLPRRETR